ncbi:Pls/PosA family non-ribosomal peptide synthetase [Pseudonocardia parietis]|uniref:Non-ribosomal peptide synthetase-like protein n=1 Tax=Pseudonocardia parietis TaxID=570936 RepID=A0ABS4VYF5_9PSEU|nr:Pls/PosA family non-ribosomal peptide synthetase [Pseudonocardia parietis]MBP2368913.1 non-ribosomal peptide synthetase-like protein [Pseudonocardia parietis]
MSSPVTITAPSVEDELCAILAEMIGTPVVPTDHFFTDAGADSMVLARFCARVRKRSDLPHVAMTDVYAHPSARELAVALAGTGPGAGPAPVETVRDGYRAVLADLLGAEVAADADVFADLGADSMTMTRFCARVRRRDDLPDVAMTDVYAHPTPASLAEALAVEAPEPAGAEMPAGPPAPAPRASTTAYVLCGAAQLFTFVAFTIGYGTILGATYLWIAQGVDLLGFYLRSLAAVSVAFAVFAVLPIAAKWLLVGRWTEREIPLWSVAYYRFWFAKVLVRTNPLLLVASGSPLLPLYLRLLGARIGPGVVMLSRTIPACPDLLTIGAGTVLRKDSLLSCYRAEPGLIRTGRVTIGADVVVGETTVIDIDTEIGDGGRLAHSSSLHAGQRIPAGETWWGTPGRRGGGDPGAPAARASGSLRRAGYAGAQLFMAVAVWLPLGTGVIDAVLAYVPTFEPVLGPAAVGLDSPLFYLEVLGVSGLLMVLGIVTGLFVTVVLARLLSLGVTEGRVYRIYGIRYTLHRTILRMTNIKFFTHLLGDSSYIVGYLRLIGYDLRRTPQTGTNFGTAVKHETPFASSIGTGTMVADGISIMNADYSNSAFVIKRTRIGARSFFGNRIAYPPDARVGDDCLIATKTLVPTDGHIRSGVGLLGSPPFEIPRSVSRDSAFDHLQSGLDLHQRLRGKNRYNRRTIGLVLLIGWGAMFGITLLTLALADVLLPLGPVAVGVVLLVSLLYTMTYTLVIERLTTLRRPLRSRLCSVYDPYFWWHERYWKLVVMWDKMLAGTPFKNVASRLLGVRIGRRVFDDGGAMTERTLVTIGDDVVLNAGSVIQCHSQEDGAFKSAGITVESGACLDVGAFVHYGAVVGENARIGCDAFLMKGEEVPPGDFWEGNPARAARHPAPPAPAPAPMIAIGETAR